VAILRARGIRLHRPGLAVVTEGAALHLLGVAKPTYRRVVWMAMASDLVKVGEAAPDLDVLSAEGREVLLSSFWAYRPVLVALLRHFG
jgi:hypothetical protein